MSKQIALKGNLNRLLFLPLGLYFLFFTLFTWPWISHFNGWFFTDAGDGLQNVWNMWWINKSVTQMGQLPWHTNFLHAPYGVTLLGQTLNPFNGFIGIFLQRFLSLNQSYNVMVILSFILAGLFMFWLCYYFTHSYIPSLIGGGIFTFSSYHLAHAVGHMQLVSLEFIPLFILLWWKLITKPTYKLAVGASFVLLLVLFCDYYYFLFSLITASFIFVYFLISKRIPHLKDQKYWLPMALFGLTSAVLVAPLPLALLMFNRKDELLGSHPARLFSTDLFSPFIDGGFWRFHSLTSRYWSHIKAFTSESSIYLGLGVIATILIAIWKRAKIHKDVVFWLLVGAFFGIMSLGPRLMVRGTTIESTRMPYIIMERLVPGMKLSGVPVRMMVMVTFASAIIAAMVLAKVNIQERKGQLILAGFVLLLVVEMFPSPLPLTPNTQPKYVYALRNLPATGSVLDNAAISESYQLYHQTTTDKPIVFGYISRIPKSVQDKDWPLFVAIDRQQYDGLCSAYGLRYITTPADRPLVTTFPIVYQDSQAIIYDIKNSPHC